MDNQGNNFFSEGNSFGIQQASVISDETADLIFGGGNTSANPAGIAPLRPKKKPKVVAPIPNEEEEDEDNDVHKNRDPFEEADKISADDLLNSIGKTKEEDDEEEEEEEDPKPAAIVNSKSEQDEDPSEADEANTFGSIAKELIKMGIFKERDEDSTNPIKNGESLRDRFMLESEDTANNKIYNFLMSKHGQEGVDAFDAIFVKGVPVKDYLSKFDQLTTFKGMDLSLEDNQKKVYREAYRRQGLAEDKIEKKLQKAIDYGDLEEETADLHDILVKQEQDELSYQIEQAASEQEAKREQRGQYMNNLNLILGQKLKDRDFDGIPVTDKVARETYDYLSTEKWVLPSGEKLTDFDKDILELRDPKNHELKVKLALLLRNKLDLSKIKTKAVTDGSNKVFDNLVKRDAQNRRTQKAAPAPNSFLDGL